MPLPMSVHCPARATARVLRAGLADAARAPLVRGTDPVWNIQEILSAKGQTVQRSEDGVLTLAARDAAGSTAHAALHLGIRCDASGMSPIVGTRFHKVNEDRDLCEAEFIQLPLDDRSAFEAIHHPGSAPIPLPHPDFGQTT